MPDPAFKSVSASQMPALFNCSPYASRWMLWQYFKSKGKAPWPNPTHDRLKWGVLLQEAILNATADIYETVVESNIRKAEYVRRGKIGHTADGRTRASDVGKILVEAKNVDRMVWRESWSETAAPQHIEIQLQTGMYADEAGRGIIAALVGGNELLFYARDPDERFWKRMKKEVDIFFESIEANDPPDPMGAPIELDMFDWLYPTAEPAKVFEDLKDPKLRDLLREMRYWREQRSIAEKEYERRKVAVAAIARDYGFIHANGIGCKIQKSAVPEAVIKRSPHIRHLYTFFDRADDKPIGDVFEQLAEQGALRG